MVLAPAVVGHVDADAFYVSCERVRFEHLKHLPVGVLGNQGACVIARSYELRAYGIKTGMPVWEAKKLCPEGVYVKRDFRWYEVISRRLLEQLHRVSPGVEYYSIDEMFFDASELPRVFGLPMPQAVRALQQRILAEVGVPVSIGVSHSKALAKLGSDSAKPFGCRTLFEQTEIEELLASQPVQEVAGIGERSRRKLLGRGILNCLDFTRADRHMIRRMLTIKGEQLWWELRGTSVCTLATTRPPHQMVNRGGSMGKATANPERVLAFLVRNIERLIEELDFHQVLTEHLSLALQYQQGGAVFGQIDLPELTERFDLLLAAGKILLQQIWSGVEEDDKVTRCQGDKVKEELFSRSQAPAWEREEEGWHGDRVTGLEVLFRDGPWLGGQNANKAERIPPLPHSVTPSPCLPLSLSPLLPVTPSPPHPITVSPGHLVTLSSPPAVNGMHLTASKLQYRHLYQGSLFARANPQAERIAQAKRFVNERMGRFAVRSGATLPLRDIYHDEAQQYDICDIRGKMCF